MDKVSGEKQSILVHGVSYSNLKPADDIDAINEDEAKLQN